MDIKKLRTADWGFRKAIVAEKAAKIVVNVPGIVHKNHIIRKNIGTEDEPVLGPENTEMITHSNSHRMMIAKQIAKWHLEKQEELLVAFAKKNGVRDAAETLMVDPEGSQVVVTHKQKAFCFEEGTGFVEL